MTPHSIPTVDLDIPENFSPDRPPTLNETICGCKCGCAGCRCDDSGGDFSPFDFNDRGDEHCIQVEDLDARLNELNLAHAEQPEALRESLSGFSHATPYQVYSIDSSTDLGAEGDADASISQFLHELCINRNEPRFLPDLPFLHTHPRNLDDLFEVPPVRPHSPGGDSLLVNPSEGEHSLVSSMTSSIQLGKHGLSPGYFTIGVGGCFENAPNHFLVRPLELTESLQHKHHCGHGVVCCSSSLAGEIVAEGPGSAFNDSHNELG